MAEQISKPNPPKVKASQKSTKVTQSSGLTEKLKVVVRRLPPNLPEDIFWQSVQDWVNENTVVWKSFHQGKLRKKSYKENVPSRAYMSFKNDELLATFSKAYDGHVFRDKAGNESQAVVEFAPCQKIPPEKKKVDARNATIMQDEDYISFEQSLTAPPPKLGDVDSLEALIAATQPPPEPKSTPLLDALRAEKSAAKDKEAILRNHAHYHHQAHDTSSAPSSKKEDAKRKGAEKHADEPHVGKKGGRGKKGDLAKAPAGGSASGSGAGRPGHSAPQNKSTPKPARAPREPAARPQQVPEPSTSSNAAAADADPVVPTAPPERRTRPTINLARNFEAALSGAGVVVAPSGAGGERRQRREREKKTDSAAGAGQEGEAATVNKDTEAKGRDRRGGGGRRKEARDGGAGESVSTSAQISKNQGPIAPTILPRPSAPSQPPTILSRTSDSTATPAVPTDTSTTEGGGRGGRPRAHGSEGGRNRDHHDDAGGSGAGASKGEGRGGRRRGRGRPT